MVGYIEIKISHLSTDISETAIVETELLHLRGNGPMRYIVEAVGPDGRIGLRETASPESIRPHGLEVGIGYFR